MPTPPVRARLAWLMLGACLLAALPPLIADLTHPDVIHSEEARVLATLADTLERQYALREAGTGPISFDLWAPHRNGIARYDMPPAGMMLYSLVHWGQRPGEISTQTLITRSRFVSVVCAVLTVAAVFWLGYSLGGLTSAAIAALCCAATPAFVQDGRLAMLAMPHLLWSTLTVAAAMWAMRPLRPAASVTRQAFGWLLAGLAMGLAVLTGGSVSVPLVVLPLMLMVVICPNRVSHLMGLIAACVLASLMVLPWMAHVYDQKADAWNQWRHEMTPWLAMQPRVLGPMLGWRLAMLAVAVLPWTVWAVAGLMQPFSTSSAGSRARLFLSWSWCVGVTGLLLLAPDISRLGGALLLVPATSVLVGQVFGQFVERSAEGRHTRLWRGLRWIYLAATTAGSIAIPALFALQPTLIDQGWLATGFSAPLSWTYWFGLAVVLLGLAVLAVRWSMQHYPGRSAAAWAVWMIVLMATLAIPLSRGPLAESLVEADASVLGQMVGSQPLFWLNDLGDARADPDAALLLHVRRQIKPITMRELDDVVHDLQQVFVLGPLDQGAAAPVVGAQAVRVTKLPAARRSLWRYTALKLDSDGAATPPSDAGSAPSDPPT